MRILIAFVVNASLMERYPHPRLIFVDWVSQPFQGSGEEVWVRVKYRISAGGRMLNYDECLDFSQPAKEGFALDFVPTARVRDRLPPLPALMLA